MADQGTSAIIRNNLGDFLNVGTFSTPRFVLLGPGFTGLDENPNAQAEQRAYISDRSTSSIIRGYEAQFPFTADMMISNATEGITRIYEVGRNQRQAAEAESEYVRVEVFMPTGIQNVHPARKFRVAIEVTDIAGEGTQIIEMSGNLNVVGDFTPGCMNIETKIFYPGVTSRTDAGVEIVTVEVGAATVVLENGLFVVGTPFGGE